MRACPWKDESRVYVYSGASTVWSQRGTPLSTGDVVAISSDGIRVAVSDTGSNNGEVSVYDWISIAGSNKALRSSVLQAAIRFGSALSFSKDGTTLAIGARNNDDAATNAGHVRVYQWDGSAWSQQGSSIVGEAAVDESGYAVSLSSDGKTLAVGSPYNDGNGFNAGHARVYVWDEVTGFSVVMI